MSYIVTIAILVDVETEAEAIDAIAEAIRPLIKDFAPLSCLRDWQWCLGEGEIMKAGPIPSDFQMDNEWPWLG